MVDGGLRSGVNGAGTFATLGRSELSIKLRHVWGMEGKGVAARQWGCTNELGPPRELRGMKWSAIFVAAIAITYAAYSLFYPTTSYRFKLTLNVNTPEGLKSGSSVMEVRDRRYPAWTTRGESSGESHLVGDAVFVDLGPARDGKPQNLVALLTLGVRGENPNLYFLPGMAFEPLWKQRLAAPGFRGASSELPKLPPGTKAELRGKLIPTMVTIGDLNDPKTARAIQPDGFSKAFGAGVTLQSATIEMVPAGTWPLTLLGIGGEPVTRGIEKKLPWWGGPGRPAEAALSAAELHLGEPELAFKRD
jgi:hypothetical protein